MSKTEILNKIYLVIGREILHTAKIQSADTQGPQDIQLLQKLDSDFLNQNPIRKNEVILVSSQKTNKEIK